MAAGSPLVRCVGDPERFAERVWGRQVLVNAPCPEGYEDLLSLDDVDHLLSESCLRTPAFRLVREGRPLPASAYTCSPRIGGIPMTGLADPARILAEIDRGATLVMQGLHRYWPPVVRFCRELELALGHPCQANAYVTPPGSQGFDPHVDAHDVFVLQAFGHKSWQVWHTPEDPCNDGAEHELLDVELTPGAALYLPTGTRHAASTQQALSGHLTIGVQQTTWRKVMQRALEQLLDDPALEAPLPVGFHRESESLDQHVRTRLEQLGRRLRAVDTQHVVADLVDTFLTGRAPALRGALVDRRRLPELADGDRLRRRPGAVCEIRGGDPVRLLLGDRELRVPGWLEPAVREIAARSTFIVRDLAAHLDATSRLVLARRLVSEGLLEVLSD
jgi:bifunctional lysine-specific demethylase and histidyl-hydroxylase NO66